MRNLPLADPKKAAFGLIPLSRRNESEMRKRLVCLWEANSILCPLIFWRIPTPTTHVCVRRPPLHIDARGLWTLTRYDDVALALRDPRFGRKAFSKLLRTVDTTPDGSWVNTPTSMLFQDQPEHTRLRAIAYKAFSASMVVGLRAHIQQIADGLVDSAADDHSMDLIDGFAFPLSVYTISQLLGVPAGDRQSLLQWSLDIMQREESFLGPPSFERSTAATESFSNYFRSLIEERRKRPQADLVTRLSVAQEGEDKLTEFELLDICCLMFLTGHQTTVNLIGNGMLALLCHPGELRKLQDDPALLPGALEELLRFESPVQRVGRITSASVEIRGKKVPKGAIVLAMIGAANRDPAQFEEPGRLNISRSDNRHLAFGSGCRFCLGAALARTEASIAFSTLLRRLPQLRLRDRRPVWRTSVEVRALEELPVTF